MLHGSEKGTAQDNAFFERFFQVYYRVERSGAVPACCSMAVYGRNSPFCAMRSLAGTKRHLPL